MSDIEKYDKVTKTVTETDSGFKGYTLDELRYQRAFVALQKEFCSAKIKEGANSMSQMLYSTKSNSALPLSGRFKPVISNMVKGLNYLDYIMIGFSIFNSTRKFISFFKKKK